MSGLKNKLKSILKPRANTYQASTASQAPTEAASAVPGVEFIDGKASYVPTNGSTPGRSDNGAWAEALAAGALALGACERSLGTGLQGDDKGHANRLKSLLQAQVDEIQDILPYTGNPRSSALSTLRDIYKKVDTTLQATSRGIFASLVDILLNGPDYLIDVGILENIVWQAEIIDSGLGADARQILDDAVRGQADDPDTFRRAAESFIALSTAVPPVILDDDDAREAYRAIGSLILHLQARLGDSRAPAMSPLASPSISRATTPGNAPGYTKYSDASEAAFGTGPIPTSTPASRQPSASATPRVPTSPTDTEASQEIWEYRGNLLTRSALSLVLRQEALAMADSSGQYAGEVSWDDVRQAYIPKWAEKLKSNDVAEGEVPSTNPAEYRVRRKDAWGNDIGWRDGIMFYKNEPSFDSPG